MSGRVVRIGLLAVLGLLVAAALGAAASRITSEQVGLYGEPPSVGSELVSGKDGGQRPDRGPEKRSGDRKSGGRGEPAPNATTGIPAPETPVASPPLTPAPAPAVGEPASPVGEPAPPVSTDDSAPEPEEEAETEDPEHEAPEDDD